MDIIRTPYTRYAFLDADQTVRVKLRWYPAPPDAKPFPGWHLFSSGDWSQQDRHYAWPGPGEDRDAGRTFYPGEGPRQHYAGQEFVGDPEWYTSGVPLDVIQQALDGPPLTPPPCFSPAQHGYPPLVICGVTTIPVCPDPTVFLSTGGTLHGGTSTAPACCRAAAPSGGTLHGGRSLAPPCCQGAVSQGGTLHGGESTADACCVEYVSQGGTLHGGESTADACCVEYVSQGGTLHGGESTFDQFQDCACVVTACCPSYCIPKTLYFRGHSFNPMTCSWAVDSVRLPLTLGPCPAGVPAGSTCWNGDVSSWGSCLDTLTVYCLEGGAFGWTFGAGGTCADGAPTGAFTVDECSPVNLLSEDTSCQCGADDCTFNFTVKES